MVYIILEVAYKQPCEWIAWVFLWNGFPNNEENIKEFARIFEHEGVLQAQYSKHNDSPLAVPYLFQIFARNFVDLLKPSR